MLGVKSIEAVIEVREILVEGTVRSSIRLVKDHGAI